MAGLETLFTTLAAAGSTAAVGAPLNILPAAASASFAAPAFSVGQAFSLLGTGLTAAGTIAAGNQAAAQGRIAQRLADREAAQLEIAGKDEFALKQREAEQFRRQKKLALSSLTNKAAGSGFSATDPTALALADEIEKYGTLQEQMAMHGGTRRREDFYDAAAGRRYEGAVAAEDGRAARTGSYLSAGGTILGGVSTFADKYNPRRRVAGYSVGRYG